MSIELKITGNHATDLVAEVQSLAQILGVGGVQVMADTTQMMARGNEIAIKAMENVGTVTPQKVAEKPAPAKAEKQKSLTRKEQDEAVSEMISNGAKDERFGLLTKGRQNEVEEALANPKPAAPVAQPEPDLDDMFGDEPKNITVTREDVSALMGKVAKDEDGNAIQDKALEIRAILVDHIPHGEEIKVRNIPEDKLGAVYALIKKLED